MSKQQTVTLDSIMAEFRGKSPDEIAAMVRRRGIKGRMGTTHGCPMAILLDNAYTGSYIIGRKYIVRRSGKTIERAPTPASVATFARKFDIGGYPDMIAPPPRCTAPRGRIPSRREHPSGSDKRKPRTVQNHIAKLVGRFHDTEAQ